MHTHANAPTPRTCVVVAPRGAQHVLQAGRLDALLRGVQIEGLRPHTPIATCMMMMSPQTQRTEGRRTPER
jgi:hypothetical protein